MANVNKSVIAAFDFDGTLSTKDSLVPFLFFSKGRVVTIKNFLLEMPLFIQYLLGRKSRQDVKEGLLTRFFKGMDKEKFLNLAEIYAKEILPSIVMKEGLDRIQWHKAQGHRCILISANLDSYLSVWAKEVGFDDVLSSEVAYKEGKVTGKLAGKNCRSDEKVRRLEALVGPLNEFTIYAYGDSAGDKELLEAADYPFYRKLN